MKKIQSIKNIKTGKTIFEGCFQTFKACLEKAIESDININHADLRFKDLSGISLDSCTLHAIDFSFSNLSGANISETILSECQFMHTDLYNACLASSNVTGCDFSHANFGATDIADAHIENCIFLNLSCFTLNFIHARTLKDNIFWANEKLIFNKPPVTIFGLSSLPVIHLDNQILHGHQIISKKHHEDIFHAKTILQKTAEK